MTTIRRHLMALAAASALVATAPVQAANLEAGQAKAKAVCAACHGVDGNSALPDYPKLAGQHRDYLEKALRDYKSGARKNPVMAANAAALSQEDIANVAAWFNAQSAAVRSRY